MDNFNITEEIEEKKLKIENRILKKKLDLAYSEIDKKDKLISAAIAKDVETVEFKLPVTKTDGEATAIFMASDWHIDELVRPETVSNLNHFNKMIANHRAEKFFFNAVALYNIQRRAIQIPNIVLALLGDFISNNIHEDSAENCTMLPMDAIMTAQNLICSGIEYILKHTNANVIVPCAVGNHSRTTKKIHIASEQGNSLEFLMYHNIANYFRKNKRVKFIITDGYHTYIELYGKTIRFSHGHYIRYGGGVGGIYIPVNKAISQWNKMRRVELDIFAHFHQFRDGGNFVCNGSLIGYNAFALSIKADFEEPKQGFFLFDKKRGKTIVAPILLNSNPTS